jgi:hypothetical protein
MLRPGAVLAPTVEAALWCAFPAVLSAPADLLRRSRPQALPHYERRVYGSMNLG